MVLYGSYGFCGLSIPSAHSMALKAGFADVGHLMHNKAVPSVLWDLNDTNPSPLCVHFNPKLVVNTMKLTIPHSISFNWQVYCHSRIQLGNL
jgi:hypothetical protein